MEPQGLMSLSSMELISVDDNLIDILLNHASFGFRKSSRREVLQQIINVVHKNNVKSVVLEHEYVDSDYLDSYSHQYARAFQHKPSLCKRAHFFTSKLTDVNQVINLKNADSSYLGYCVFRPTGDQFVGRTVIVPPFNSTDSSNVVHTVATFSSHLIGQRLAVRGTPFIQQDRNTFVCAGAALWTIAYLMHHQGQCARFYPVQINEFARQLVSYGQIRKGLRIDQMVMALRTMGFNPHVLSYVNLKNSNEITKKVSLATIADFMHTLIDSGIPPLLIYSEVGSDGHAVAVVGHDIVMRDKTDEYVFHKFGQSYRNSYFIDKFYVMDDARGPYVDFHIWHDGLIDSLESCEHITVIAPMPPEATLEYEDVFADSIVKLAHSQREDGDRDATDNQIVLKATLCDSRKWKYEVMLSKYPNDLKLLYRSMLLPKYVWVIEMSDWNHINVANRQDRCIFGEILLDATANPHWVDDSLLSVRTRQKLVMRGKNDTRHEYEIGGQSWYQPVRFSQ